MKTLICFALICLGLIEFSFAQRPEFSDPEHSALESERESAIDDVSARLKSAVHSLDYFTKREILFRLTTHVSMRALLNVPENRARSLEAMREELLTDLGNPAIDYQTRIDRFFEQLTDSLPPESIEKLSRNANLSFVHGQLSNFTPNRFYETVAASIPVLARREEPEIKSILPEYAEVACAGRLELQTLEAKTRDELFRKILDSLPEAAVARVAFLQNSVATKVSLRGETFEEKEFCLIEQVFETDSKNPIDEERIRNLRMLYELTENQEADLESRLNVLDIWYQKKLIECGHPSYVNMKLITEEQEEIIRSMPAPTEQTLEKIEPFAAQYRREFKEIVNSVLLPHQQQMTELLVNQSELSAQTDENPLSVFRWPILLKEKMGLSDSDIAALEKTVETMESEYQKIIDHRAEELTEQLLEIIPGDLHPEILDLIENYENSPDLSGGYHLQLFEETREQAVELENGRDGNDE